jgi:hypothetical protein
MLDLVRLPRTSGLPNSQQNRSWRNRRLKKLVAWQVIPRFQQPRKIRTRKATMPVKELPREPFRIVLTGFL